MKRSTALKNVQKMIDRVRAINGILATPMHNNPFVKVKRMWLFGSVAKGAVEPNDIDIFVELIDEEQRYTDELIWDKCYPRVYRERWPHFRKHKRLSGAFKMDKQAPQWRNMHIPTPPRSDFTFIKWLRKDIRKVSVHVVGHDEIFDKLDTKIMLYPRNDFSG